jgi:hypothetical protein
MGAQEQNSGPMRSGENGVRPEIRRAEAGAYAREIEHLTASLRNLSDAKATQQQAGVDELRAMEAAICARLDTLLGIEHSTENQEHGRN